MNKLKCPKCGSTQVLTRLTVTPAHVCRVCGAKWGDYHAPQGGSRPGRVLATRPAEGAEAGGKKEHGK